MAEACVSLRLTLDMFYLFLVLLWCLLLRCLVAWLKKPLNKKKNKKNIGNPGSEKMLPKARKGGVRA